MLTTSSPVDKHQGGRVSGDNPRAIAFGTRGQPARNEGEKSTGWVKMQADALSYKRFYLGKSSVEQCLEPLLISQLVWAIFKLPVERVTLSISMHFFTRSSDENWGGFWNRCRWQGIYSFGKCDAIFLPVGLTLGTTHG